MDRYLNIPTKINESGRRVTRAVIYPPIPRSEKDVYIMTTPGDRLDLLAQNYYGNVNAWWILAEANAIGKGSFDLPPGLQLRIPKDLATIMNDYKALNT
jgi:hypothetical protein